METPRSSESPLPSSTASTSSSVALRMALKKQTAEATTTSTTATASTSKAATASISKASTSKAAIASTSKAATKATGATIAATGAATEASTLKGSRDQPLEITTPEETGVEEGEGDEGGDGGIEVEEVEEEGVDEDMRAKIEREREVKNILLFLTKLPESTSLEDLLFYETCKRQQDTNNDAAQLVPAAQEIQVPKIAEEIQLLTSSAVQSVIQEIQTPAPTTINVSEKEIKKPKHVSKIPKMKPHVKNSPYTTSSVIALFKPPVHSDSPMLASYGK
ncbi:hypothetical protein F8M41_009278 [Gigaspora margarita]|uniref:Uncharacterized protein n=1 Tax=Gigaspora margarita TaxID=4874 RepID=A0A8H4B495_GIGMA|nr:hypothetical protein F8M41_009278 [Gigaspora margarita]